MRIYLAGIVALAACGPNQDRLTEEQAAAVHNRPVEPPPVPDQAPPPPPAPAAIAYKAVGTEPGWALTVSGAAMIYQGDYGSVTIRQGTPANFRAGPGEYSTPRLRLKIAPGPCSDGMSDLVYRHKVELVADGNPVTGCGGGTVIPGGLAGTRWTVAAINGRSTPAAATYFIAFGPATIDARFGCNGIGGKWYRNGDHLSASELTQTEMACPEPAMTLERLGSAILNSNMRIEQGDGERMRLVSEAGSIDLRRAI